MQNDVKEILEEVESMFLFNEDDFKAGQAKVEEVVYELTDDEPVFEKLRRTEGVFKNFVASEMEKMSKMEAIRESNSCYSSPLLVATHKEKPRLVHDYSKVNLKIKSKRYVLPRIEDILSTVSDAKFKAICDFYKAFFQVKISESSSAVTAFQTWENEYEYTVMPMGIKINPHEFQRRIDKILGKNRFKRATAFIDDVIITGKTWAEFL